MNTYDIIVAGGGAAGIAAAMHCAAHGRRVLLVESSAGLGGRARSFVDKSSGDTIDNGQHALMGCYEHFLDILNRLGTDSLLLRQSALKVPFRDASGRDDILDASALPGAAGVAAGILRMKGISARSRRAALLFAIRLRLGLSKPGSMTALEFLMSEQQPRDIIERLWEPVILATLNGRPQDVAASLLVNVLRLAFFGKKGASSLLLPTVGLSGLFQPFPAWLAEHGGRCMLQQGIKSVIMQQNRATGIILEDDSVMHADSIILALPPRALLRCLPDQVKTHSFFEVLPEYSYSPIVSLYLWFDIPFPAIPFAALLGMETQWVFNKRLLQGNPDDKALLALTISAGNSLVDKFPEQVAQACAQEICNSFPEMKNAQLLHWKVIKEKSATFLAHPELEDRRLQQKTPFQGLFIAGDWTATKLPATLEGAALSGVKAGRAAMNL